MKTVLMRSLSASAILMTLFSVIPASPLAIHAANAQVSVSANINIGTFYDRLGPYGNWTSYHGRYVWLPNNIEDNWRPYTRGHWVLTDDYGWLWVSAEPFGWATYHYGRWGYDPVVGWYWVPGQRWAPAWVAWNRNDDDVAWAPLPPRYGDDDVNLNISIGDVPDYYWQAVPVSAFLSINISNDIIRDRDRVRMVADHGGPQSVRFQNNTVINNFIDPTFVEQRTGKKVDRMQVRPVNSPDQAGKPGGNGGVGIFNPQVNDRGNFQPKKLQNFDQISNDRKQHGFKPLDDKGTPPPPPGQGNAAGNNGDNAGQPNKNGQNGTNVIVPPSAKPGNKAPGNPPAGMGNNNGQSGQPPMLGGKKNRNKFDNNGNPQMPQAGTGNQDNNPPLQQMRKPKQPMNQGQDMGQPKFNGGQKFNGGSKFNNGGGQAQPKMPMRQNKFGQPGMNNGNNGGGFNGGQPKPERMPGMNKNNGQNPNVAPGQGKKNGVGGPPPPPAGRKDKVPCDPNAGACPPAQ